MFRCCLQRPVRAHDAGLSDSFGGRFTTCRHVSRNVARLDAPISAERWEG